MAARAKKAETKEAAPVAVHLRYVGDKRQFFIGVPARDLTKAEFDALDPLQQRDVLASNIYEQPEAEQSDDKGSESETN
jgi:hypothetical protein